MTPGLGRFVEAQRPVYPEVLAELGAGTKRTHWMWFIFPQIAGLGRSPAAQKYAIADLDEARAYLAHAVLGPRLLECTGAMLSWAGRKDAETILGPVDAMKLRSSMTLFESAGGGAVFSRALESFFGGERDEATLVRL